ncbi:MAG: response regulator [Actinobacteria bacterium]|nr:MAG: response regulator [Actinomycetota bacterium]
MRRRTTRRARSRLRPARPAGWCVSWLTLAPPRSTTATIAAARPRVAGARWRIDGPQAGRYEVVLGGLRPPARSVRVGPVALRCLIVDDSDEFVASATRLLESQGMRVIGHASSRDGALQLAEALEPDVALIDIELGEEDGIELAHRLEERVPSTRIVLISAHEQDELGELIADCPAVGFLAKEALGATAIAGMLR